MTYVEFFRQAMCGDKHGLSVTPFDYQRHLAEEQPWRQLIDVPTGLGKTAAVVLAWLWKRRIVKDPETPRRLVYCLPMRVLVEQTRNNVHAWLKNLGLCEQILTQVLMGGGDLDGWDLYPEREAILIGTQDMLLSRALNRGYGTSRYRWPLHFGLLNNDCLWVLDEVQLMGSGLATTAQLAAFRQSLGDGLEGQPRVLCLWMSATLAPAWLRTVDFEPEQPVRRLGLSDGDKADSAVFRAHKPLRKAKAAINDSKALALEIVGTHRSGSRTLVVVNTVQRAREVYQDVAKSRLAARLVLIHSRFRPQDRREKIQQLLKEPSADGAIVVSTQVVEAGVDVSAKTLFTELAPWASLVQRFGRCNRRGEFNSGDPAQVLWIDLPADEKQHVRLAQPYDLSDSTAARELLGRCSSGVGPEALQRVEAKLEFAHTHVIRRKDLIELFDTTPDLAGNDIDIDRYVRDNDSSDVQVFWRELDREPPPDDALPPSRDELCPAPIGGFKAFLELFRKVNLWAYRRNYLERRWERVDAAGVYPGQTYMLDSAAGGYSSDLGWTGELSKKGEQPVQSLLGETRDGALGADDDYDADAYSQINKWQTLAEHSDAICAELQSILDALRIHGAERNALLTAARWHDLGKAHWVFRHALPLADSGRDPFLIWAKAHGTWKRYRRRHFRHELASALAVLQEQGALIPEEQRSLIAYLVAAHHGKVRLSIRSMPNETRPPDPEVRFARGVWDGDELPQAELGGGVVAPAVTLSLEPMELGLAANGQPSWVERILELRDDPAFGPFRLAYLEALVRAADMRVSVAAYRS